MNNTNIAIAILVEGKVAKYSMLSIISKMLMKKKLY